MHPRMLARDGGCSGGTCPAVYDLDDLPDEFVIQGKQASAELLGRLTGVAPDENAVIIGREIVRNALYPAAEPVDLAHLMRQFETFAYSAFRLEALQHYDGTGRDDEWITLLKAGRRWGKTHQRVHVVIEPLTGAMEQELTEGYGPNCAAGEDIGIIPVASETEWPGDVPGSDFWLFDSIKLYRMLYQGGRWAGAFRVYSPHEIMQACLARDAALHRATPWKQYIASRPDLKRRLAQ